MGYLTVLFGCMFAQKTTELLRRIRRYRSIDYSVLVVNYKGDTRYGQNSVISHDGDSFIAESVECLKDIEQLVETKSFKVIVIDEGQFFPDLLEYVKKWTDTLPIHIIVTGLDGDSDRRPFGQILQLIPLAEEVERLSAYCSVCKDGTLAHFSKYIAGKKDGQVEIGGADRYIPVCRAHYLKNSEDM